MNKKATVLILSYMVVAALATISSAFLMRTVSERIAAEQFSNSTKAFWAAEAGLQHAIRDFENENLENWEFEETEDGALYRLTTPIAGSLEYELEIIEVGSNRVLLHSVGYASGLISPDYAQRKVSVAYQSGGSLFNYAAFGNSGVSLLGNARVDSYDSRLGPYGGENVGDSGNVVSSIESLPGSVELTGSSKIYGNVESPNGEIPFCWSCEVTGTISDTNSQSVDPVIVPDELSSLASGESINLTGSNSQVLSSGNYSLPSINVLGNAQLTLEGDVNIYLTDASSLNIGGSGRLIVNGTANIYIDGSASTTGAGIVTADQSPANFIVYGTSSSDSINIAGSGSVYGAIHAPNAAISVTGNARLFGSALGDSVDVTGSSRIHYDKALLDGAGSSSTDYVLMYWREDR